MIAGLCLRHGAARLHIASRYEPATQCAPSAHFQHLAKVYDAAHPRARKR
jgi:hypothetical protein